MTMEITVKGMSCGHCAAAVTKALGALPGVSQVQVDLATGRVTFENRRITPGGVTRSWPGRSKLQATNLLDNSVAPLSVTSEQLRATFPDHWLLITVY